MNVTNVAKLELNIDINLNQYSIFLFVTAQFMYFKKKNKLGSCYTFKYLFNVRVISKLAVLNYVDILFPVLNTDKYQFPNYFI